MDRSELVSNAVQFLQDSSVKHTPLPNRIAFLEKKGLSSEEIDSALKQTGLDRPNPVDQFSGPTAQQGQTQPSAARSGPPERLAKLATSNGVSWSKLVIYTALLSSTVVAVGRSTVLVPH